MIQILQAYLTLTIGLLPFIIMIIFFFVKSRKKPVKKEQAKMIDLSYYDVTESFYVKDFYSNN